MKETILRLQKILETIPQQLQHISDEQMHDKPRPEKWSKKEIIGHLIDSAFNNYNRFIRAQYENVPHLIYNQDAWNNLGNYQTRLNEEVIELWQLINLQVLHALKHMDEKNYSRNCDVGRDGSDLRTIEWLAHDYVDHVEHHLHQVIESYEIGEANTYLKK